jgi:hypothetical protein
MTAAEAVSARDILANSALQRDRTHAKATVQLQAEQRTGHSAPTAGVLWQSDDNASARGRYVVQRHTRLRCKGVGPRTVKLRRDAQRRPQLTGTPQHRRQTSVHTTNSTTERRRGVWTGVHIPHWHRHPTRRPALRRRARRWRTARRAARRLSTGPLPTARSSRPQRRTGRRQSARAQCSD